MLDGAAGLDGFKGVHGKMFLRFSGASGLDFDMKMNVVIDDVFSEKGKESAGAVLTAELSAVDLKLCLTCEVIIIR